MPTLLFTLVGFEDGIFDLDVNGDETVKELKGAIKVIKPNEILCDGDDPQLYLATEGYEWLSEDSDLERKLLDRELETKIFEVYSMKS